jgi:hypothetical protein
VVGAHGDGVADGLGRGDGEGECLVLNDLDGRRAVVLGRVVRTQEGVDDGSAFGFAAILEFLDDVFDLLFG